MRLIAYAKITVLSSTTVLLSGCSWFGFGSQLGGYQQQPYQAQSTRYKGSQIQYNTQPGRRALGRCQITTPTQRIPQGCRPEQVTLGLGGSQAGYSQQAQYTSGGYGSHVGDAQTAQVGYAPQPRVKRPRLRGQFGLEIDRSVFGKLYDPSLSSVATYHRPAFEERTVTGSPATGQTVTNRYYSAPERIVAPTISFDDVYTAPLRVTGGLEFIMDDHISVFANAGYTWAEGKKGGGVQVIDTLRRDTTTQGFDKTTGLPIGRPVESLTTFIPNAIVATYDYNFNELHRYDFEAGGRYYFNPILKKQLNRPLTPFVAASGGVSHYNATSFKENQRQRFIGRVFEGTQVNKNGDFYDVNFGAKTQIYGAQWVPYGAVKAGLEWQMTAKTALAFEAGVKYEGARNYTIGNSGNDGVISIPVTIRGSYNF